jgi:transcriptional regulator with GAF, ATPase, and Fis domain/tetratricopeptide (TPR) repeat protein
MLSRDRHDPQEPNGRGSAASLAALEEVGDVHFGTEAFSPALEYYENALRGLGTEVEFDPTVAARLNRKISDCLRSRGQLDQAHVYLERARIFLKGYEYELEHGLMLGRRADLLCSQGRHEVALEDARIALEILKATAAHREYAFVLRVAARCNLRLGRAAESEQLNLDALAAYRRIEDQEGIADVLNNLGLAYKNACQWDKAIRSLTQARDIAERLGVTRRLARTLGNLGIVYTKTREFHEAVAHLRRARRLATALGDEGTVVSCLNSLGRVLVAMGKYSQAEKYLLEARVVAERHQLARSLALADEFLGDSMFAQGRLAEARENYDAGLKKARSFAPKGDVVGEILRRQAELQLRCGLRSEAIAIARRALKVCESCGETHEVGYILRTLGLASAGLGHPAEAVKCLVASVAAFERTANPFEAAWSRIELGRLYCAQGDAEGLLRAAHEAAAASEALHALEEDHGYCAAGLVSARAHLGRGEYDDGLLALYDVERLCEDNPSFGLLGEAQALRRDLESALMARSSHGSSGATQLFSDLYALARSANDLEPGLRQSLEALRTRVAASSAFLALRFPGEATAHLHGTSGIGAEEALGLACSMMSDGCRPHVLAQVDGTFAAQFADLAARAGAVLWHPLCAGEQVIGVVYVERARAQAPRPFGSDDVDVVATFASMVSVLVAEHYREQLETPEAQPGRDDLHPAMRRLITTDASMLRVMALAQKVAASTCTVLLSGETGTGKGLLAHGIHMASERRGRKFVALNCAALPEPLLESELFGHARGAFTGADSDKMGLLEAATGGTVFLDEVGKTSLFMQGKLLQFLDSSEVRPVGSNVFRKVDVRVIVATKGNIKELVSQGLFLEDLYYRLNDFPITIPPLRSRRGDVKPLVEHYLHRYRSEMQKTIPGVSRQAMQLLEAYAWPGNVRELEKCIKRAVILADDRQPITVRHLPDELKALSDGVDEAADPAGLTLREHVAQLESHLIQVCLRRSDGNKSEAARMLGISYPSLLQKIKLYGSVAEPGEM